MKLDLCSISPNNWRLRYDGKVAWRMWGWSTALLLALCSLFIFLDHGEKAKAEVVSQILVVESASPTEVAAIEATTDYSTILPVVLSDEILAAANRAAAEAAVRVIQASIKPERSPDEMTMRWKFEARFAGDYLNTKAVLSKLLVLQPTATADLITWSKGSDGGMEMVVQLGVLSRRPADL
ncbi:hypothetical protein [Rubrivivax gelatinosus]|uniref:hypothetical protein n=1 Tax=Rubrivivax gelatinosus TaxID=28068 RepID=UPI0010436231|nr:hypothetical protein [Rubrivivax gelatinosus]